MVYIYHMRHIFEQKMTKQKILIGQKREKPKLPFVVQVAENPKVQGVTYGSEAMKKSGVQQEFIAVNMLQTAAMRSALILRAGDPPQYDKRRGPKSGVNLSKTSKQGFFVGALAAEERFGRIENGAPRPHHKDDSKNLKKRATDPDYQHTMQLDINMRDILRAVGPDGDMRVLGFDPESGILRVDYKPGKGPPSHLFNGQFAINLLQGSESPQFYSREWNRPEHEPNWDPQKQVITKPAELSAIPDRIYEAIFENTFLVGYTENKAPIEDPNSIQQARVFANRPRTAIEFQEAMGKNHRYYHLIENCETLPQILETLAKALPPLHAEKTILDVYNKTSRIVTGDWDGLALGHPPSIDPKFAEEIDVFAKKNEGLKNQRTLMNLSNEYLQQLKQAAREKIDRDIPLTPFDEKILTIEDIREIVGEFALTRAGHITPHEFVFQQVINDVYRDKANRHFGEQYDAFIVQEVMNRLLKNPDILSLPKDDCKQLIGDMLRGEIYNYGDECPTGPVIDKIADHLMTHFSIAVKMELDSYTVPHIQHDMNVHDLYQHGFDMRNPYGSNLEGAWLLITEEGALIHGETQEQLIEVLLTGDFLEKNHIDINHGANMSAGWDRVIARQIELDQTVPAETLEKYDAFIAAQRNVQEASAHEQQSLIDPNILNTQRSAKQELYALRNNARDAHNEAEEEFTDAQSSRNVNH
jgi:hypothetical protein